MKAWQLKCPMRARTVHHYRRMMEALALVDAGVAGWFPVEINRKIDINSLESTN